MITKLRCGVKDVVVVNERGDRDIRLSPVQGVRPSEAKTGPFDANQGHPGSPEAIQVDF